VFERALGVTPLGYAAHGGIPSAGHLGLRQVDWALENGLVYGEMLGGGSTLPHQAVVLRNDLPSASELILPAQHRGLDLTMSPGGHCLDSLLPEAREALRQGEHLVLMNHPDIHGESLRQLLDSLDLSGVWNATLAEVASWFRASRLHERVPAAPAA
jgi:hypothetical protein